MNQKPLPRSFYASLDALTIAQNLLGKVIVATIDGKICSGVIVETEAYMAPEDLACHARGNKRTPRTETMFSAPGTAYVYKCYGIHDLFNVVTAPVDVAHAILIRAVEPLHGVQWMAKRRSMDCTNPAITNGPGKLTSALGINVHHDRMDLTDLDSEIVIFNNTQNEHFEIIEGPRVGMSRHTRHCGHYPWRYRIKNNRWTSKPNLVQYNW